MSPNIFPKRPAQVFIFVFLLLALSGCPLMMPFMMGPMLSKNMDKPTDPLVKATVEELIQEGISQLAYNRGPYKLMALGEEKISGDVISVTKFQQILKENLRSRSEWDVLGQHGKAKASGETSASVEEIHHVGMGLLNAQLYKVDDSLYLALQLLDARSNEAFWSGSTQEYSLSHPRRWIIRRSKLAWSNVSGIYRIRRRCFLTRPGRFIWLVLPIA